MRAVAQSNVSSALNVVIALNAYDLAKNLSSLNRSVNTFSSLKNREFFYNRDTSPLERKLLETSPRVGVVIGRKNLVFFPHGLLRPHSALQKRSLISPLFSLKRRIEIRM